MSFRKYAEYQDSGVAWLGEIPAGWTTQKLKFVARVQPSNVDKKSKENEEKVLLCNYTDVYYNEEITADLPFMKATASDVQIRKFTLKSGDTIITKDSEDPNDIAVPAYVPKDLEGVVCGYHLALLRPENGTCGGYLKRVMDTHYARSFFATRANGITRYGLGIYAISNFILPFPPLEEQKQIAAFLDKETTKIDALVEKQEQLITLLREKRQAIISHAVTRGLNPNVKMKDSGIEWLGEVPEHWEMGHLRWFISIKSGEGLSNSQFSKETLDEDSYPVIGGNGTMGYSKHFNTTQKAFAIGRVGALCGNVHFLKEKCWITDNALKISKWEGFNDSYFEYMLRAANLNQYANQSAQPLITGEQVKALPVPRLPLEEQKQIAAFLNEETTKIDTLIEKCETAIELLKERRTALISAAVTGKIDVRNTI